jgi:hypothetical protein
LIFGAVGWYFLRTQERRNALRSALGIAPPDGYKAVRQRVSKAKYDVELSDNLLYGSDDDEDSDSDGGGGGHRGANTPTDDAYGSGLLGSLGLKERMAETSLSLDMINGSDEDDSENDMSKDEALLPL